MRSTGLRNQIGSKSFLQNKINKKEIINSFLYNKHYENNDDINRIIFLFLIFFLFRLLMEKLEEFWQECQTIICIAHIGLNYDNNIKSGSNVRRK